MKKNLLLALAVCAAMPAFCQKVDLDGKKITVRFVQLPANPLPEGFTNYSVNLSANPGDLSAVGLSETFFTNNMVVPGYSKVPEGGNFNLTLTLHDYKQIKGESKTNSTKSKDKAGKETTTYSYYYEANFEHMLTLLVRSQENPKIEQRNWLEGTRTYKSKEFNNSRDLNTYVTKQIGRDIAKKDQDDLVSSMKSIRNHLAARYGYQDWAEYPKLMYLDSEKHPDYAGFLEAFNTTQKALESMRPQESLDAARAMAAPAIEYFDKQKNTYDASDKNGRKMKYACLYNLMHLYFWLEDFDKATETANALIANDYDEKDGKRMLDDIAEVRKALDACRKTTRHFVYEVPGEPVQADTSGDSQSAEDEPQIQYQTDSEERKSAYKERALGLTANTVQYEGTVLGTDGTETAALFLVENPGAVGLRFSHSGNFRYAVDRGETFRVFRLDKSKVAQFSFDGKTYKIVSFRSANSVNLGSNNNTVFEVLYDAPTIAAYLAYSGDNEGVNNPPEYVIENKKDQTLTSLNSMKFALNLNKGITKTYSDCPEVLEAAKAGTFKRTADEIVRLAKMLEPCMQ